MTIFEMLEQSGIMALLGMSVVFGFLIVMVIVISLAGKILAQGEQPVCAATAPGNSANPGDANITAAISAAVNEFRKNS